MNWSWYADDLSGSWAPKSFWLTDPAGRQRAVFRAMDLEVGIWSWILFDADGKEIEIDAGQLDVALSSALRALDVPRLEIVRLLDAFDRFALS
jgi:hypothetical protein